MSFFRRSSPKSVFYHEDEYLQIEILPTENLNRLQKEAQEVADFSKKHKSGEGYTDMYVRQEAWISLSHRRIQADELEQILISFTHLRAPLVTTGIRPGEFTSKNTIGFGKNYQGLFYNHEDHIVQNIWVSNSLPFEEKTSKEVLLNLGRKWNLLLMDWFRLVIIDLQDPLAVERYLRGEN